MKKLIIILLVISFERAISQISLDYTYPHPGLQATSSRIFIDKFHVSGYKYVQIDYFGKTINLYNINHTLFKSVVIPSFAGTNGGVFFVTENLFDLDNGIEFVTQNISPNGIWIVDETGTQILFRDSASISNNNGNAMDNFNGIYTDGVSTKMMLNITYNASVYKHEVYNLPGTIPCVACTSGTLSGFSTIQDPNIESPQFFPNPTPDQLKLKYKLPNGSHLAEMKIYDTQGKLVDEFKVTDTFDFIYLPTNYNNGLYLYSLIVDGKIVKTEKIVLNK